MGQPGAGQPASRAARPEQTRGTETSQYPEEEKARAISSVAASEGEGAQTVEVLKAEAVASAG